MLRVGETVLVPRPGTKMKMAPAKILQVKKGIVNVQFEDSAVVHQVKLDQVQPMPKEERKSRQSKSPARSRARTRSSSRNRATVRPQTSRSRSRSRSRNRMRANPVPAVKTTARVRTAASTTQTYNLAYNSVDGHGNDNGDPVLNSVPVPLETRVVTPIEGPDHARGQPEKHFGGALGTGFLTLALPVAVLGVNWFLMKKVDTVDYWKRLETKDLYDPVAVAIFFGWMAFQAVLYSLPVGKVVNGTRMAYRCNGFLAFLLTMAALGGAAYCQVPVDMVLDKLSPLIFTSIVFSFVLSAVLYLKARHAPCRSLALYGNSGNFVYDFFAGRELNPRIGNFDLKTFLELRPGLIGWAVFNLLLLWKDYSVDGRLSHGLLLTAACQIFYVADALYFEECLLSTMDITTEGLGFMLVFGNVTFVPFVFSIQSRYVLGQNNRLPWYYLAALALLNLVGYVIFRCSNLQKAEFRKNPHQPALMRLETIKTGTPKEILAGGWWGFVRHPNYFGDLLMAWSWCLVAGFQDWVPYTYAVYLTVLLMHRAVRDDSFCKRKYGAAWDTYRNSVKSRIFRGVF